MGLKDIETRRSISQVIFKHTPGSILGLDEYNVSGLVKEIQGDPDPDINKDLLCKNIEIFVRRWSKESENRVLGFENNIPKHMVVAIRPDSEASVRWDIFPIIFECTNNDCKIITEIKDINPNGKCHNCGSGLRQFKYVWFHICGSISSLKPINQISCPTHKRKYLYLHDTGRFKTSTWRCRKCNYHRFMGMLPCTNPSCKSKRKPYEQSGLQASIWNDPWVYFTQTVSFVNINNKLLNQISESSTKKYLMVKTLLGENPKTLNSDDLEIISKKKCIQCETELQIGAKFCSNCGELQPENVLKLDIDEINNLNNNIFDDGSELTTFTILNNLNRSTSVKKIVNDLDESIPDSKKDYFKLTYKNLKNIGIDDLVSIEDFPITHAAIGYSRFQSKPPSWLRPFYPIPKYKTKFPIYTNCVTTEAWLIQLSSKYLIKWLSENKIDIDKDTNIDDLLMINENKSKLLLLQKLFCEENSTNENKLLKIITELLHSFSHALLHTLAIESGLDISNFGEILLPSVLSFIVYAGESDLGGLSASFNQNLNLIINSLIDNFRECKFDPSCSEDDDGSCVGCIYIPRGCVLFNDNLSRTYLFGGKTKKLEVKNINIGYFDVGS